MTKSAALIGIAIALSIVVETIRQVVASLFHENFLFGIAGALSLGTFERDFLADEVAVGVQNPLGEKVAGVARDGHLQAT